MKKGLFALAGLFLLHSCMEGVKDGAANREDNEAITMAKRNSENNEEIYRALETGDVSKLDSFIARDIIDHEGNNGKDIVGIDSLKHHLGKVHTYFEGLKFDVLSEGTSLDNTYHFAMIRTRGKTKANPWGMPVGMDVDDTNMDVVKMKDGKATEHWSFTSQKDINEMMSAMSGNKPPPPPVKASANR